MHGVGIKKGQVWWLWTRATVRKRYSSWWERWWTPVFAVGRSATTTSDTRRTLLCKRQSTSCRLGFPTSLPSWRTLTRRSPYLNSFKLQWRLVRTSGISYWTRMAFGMSLYQARFSRRGLVVVISIPEFTYGERQGEMLPE